MEPGDKVEWQCPRAGYRTGTVLAPELEGGLVIAVDDIGEEKPVVYVKSELVAKEGAAEEAKKPKVVAQAPKTPLA